MKEHSRGKDRRLEKVARRKRGSAKQQWWLVVTSDLVRILVDLLERQMTRRCRTVEVSYKEYNLFFGQEARKSEGVKLVYCVLKTKNSKPQLIPNRPLVVSMAWAKNLRGFNGLGKEHYQCRTLISQQLSMFQLVFMR